MKKLLIIGFLLLFCTQVYSQTKVRGNYKGKQIKVDYYNGDPDDIISVEYELVNDLQAQKKQLENEKSNLESRLTSLRQEVQGLRGHINQGENYSYKTVDSLKLLVIRKEYIIDSLSVANNDLSKQIQSLNKQINDLSKDNKALRQANNDYLKRIDSLQKYGVVTEKYYPSGNISASFALGMPFLSNDLIKEDFWGKNTGLTTQVHVVYETSRIKPAIPISFGAGLGMSTYKTGGYFARFEEEVEVEDEDRDEYKYTAICKYRDVKEEISLIYIDIPLYVAFGQPQPHKISGYGKIGLTPSFNISTKFMGEGRYDISGKYPQWGDVIISDVPELGFLSESECYNDKKEDNYQMNLFVLRGSIAGGIYIPCCSLKKGNTTSVIFKAGVRVDYTFNAVSKKMEDPFISNAKYHINYSNLLGGDKTRITSIAVEVGLIFLLNY